VQEANYNQPQSTYPGSNYFPPPPGQAQVEPVYQNVHADPYGTNRDSTAAAQDYSPYATYNPADYPPAGTHQPYEQTRGVYGESDATLGAPYPGQDTFAGDSRYAAPEDAAAQREREHEMREDAQEARRGRDPGNVSGPSVPTMNVEQRDSSGVASEEDQDAGTSLHAPWS
jgi:hypothetical protein